MPSLVARPAMLRRARAIQLSWHTVVVVMQGWRQRTRANISGLGFGRSRVVVVGGAPPHRDATRPVTKSRLHFCDGSGRKSVKHVLVQSHRGGGAITPENTIESFIASWALGVVPEADLRTTRDRVIVAFHDPTFARVVNDLIESTGKSRTIER